MSLTRMCSALLGLWLTDRRMALLASKWGGETVVEANRGQLACNERWAEAYRNSDITNFPDSRTLRATLRLATGLEDPLPRGES
jgi:hypothetical protein